MTRDDVSQSIAIFFFFKATKKKAGEEDKGTHTHRTTQNNNISGREGRGNCNKHMCVCVCTVHIHIFSCDTLFVCLRYTCGGYPLKENYSALNFMMTVWKKNCSAFSSSFFWFGSLSRGVKIALYALWLVPLFFLLPSFLLIQKLLPYTYK